MSKVFVLFLMTLIFGCGNSNEKIPENNIPQKDTTKQIIIDKTKPELVHDHWEEVIKIPDGFKVDTVVIRDSALHLESNIVYAHLKDPNQSAFNISMKQMIISKMNLFKKDVKRITKRSGPGSGSYIFEAHPDILFENNDLASVRFIITVYYAGGVHPYSDYATINYDKRSKKAFSNADFFDFKTSANKEFIVAKLDKEFSYVSKYRTAGESLWEFYKINEKDFTLLEDSIAFNFDDYALGQGPSMFDYKVSRKELESVINKNYRLE